jgi:hypothetical protein
VSHRAPREPTPLLRAPACDRLGAVNRTHAAIARER